MLDAIILDTNITSRDFMTFCMVAKHMNDEGKRAFPSTSTLAFMMRVDRRNVQRSLTKLTALGYLKAFPLKRHATTYELGDKLTPLLAAQVRRRSTRV